MFPHFYGDDMLLPEGQTPAYLGQAVAILIYHDFARFRFAKYKLQFNDAVIRYGAVTGPLQRDPWGSVPLRSRRRQDAVRRGCFLPYEAGNGLSRLSASTNRSGRSPAPDGDCRRAGHVLRRCDRRRARASARRLAGADARLRSRNQATPPRWSRTTPMAGTTRRSRSCTWSCRRSRRKKWQRARRRCWRRAGLALKRLFLHPCFTVGYGSKDHCTMPYYGLVAALYGDGAPGTAGQ